MRSRLLSSAALLGFLAAGAAPSIAWADGPALRGDVTARRDTLTLGDLVAGVPAGLAETPLFRAPALGTSGTIQARRIASAAEALGLTAVETGGRLQITITRAARHVGQPEVETALRAALATTAGFDPVATGVAFDGGPPALMLPPDVTGPVEVSDLAVDRRNRRMAATVWVGPSPTERRASLRVSGAIVDLVSVPVVARSLERGESVRPSDIAVEQRPRDGLPADALSDEGPLEGRVAKRALAVGTALRSGDLARPDLVNKGDLVTAVFDAPGMNLSLRVTATSSGARGDTISVLNPASKKTVQAVVIGPARVSVGPGRPVPRLAAATP